MEITPLWYRSKYFSSYGLDFTPSIFFGQVYIFYFYAGDFINLLLLEFWVSCYG